MNTCLIMNMNRVSEQSVCCNPLLYKRLTETSAQRASVSEASLCLRVFCYDVRF